MNFSTTLLIAGFWIFAFAIMGLGLRYSNEKKKYEDLFTPLLVFALINIVLAALSDLTGWHLLR